MKLNTPLLAMSLICCTAAHAQQPAEPAPTKATAQSEAGEPRANTSSAQAAPPAGAQADAGEPRVTTSPPPGAKAASTPPAAAPAAKKGASATDRLELSTATVTGDREQPKVMYIVPWKKSDIGDLAGKPMNSLVDEILSPIDRDEFKREVRYYQTVKSDANQNGAQQPPGQGEK